MKTDTLKPIGTIIHTSDNLALRAWRVIGWAWYDAAGVKRMVEMVVKESEVLL